MKEELPKRVQGDGDAIEVEPEPLGPEGIDAPRERINCGG
jgi:hypothetical protein